MTFSTATLRQNKRLLMLLAVLAAGQAITLYIPATRHDCPRAVGMAWAPGQLVDQSKRDFCAPVFFHSVSYTPHWRARGGVPVIRSADYIQRIGELKAEAYSGDVLLLNEPDGAGQDNIDAHQAADIYRTAVRNLPGARIVAPNAIDTAYLIAFLAELGGDWRQSDVIGVHIYQPGDPPRPVIWPAAWLANIDSILAARGVTSAVWVSEVGPSQYWTDDDLQRYYRELLDSDAEQVFIFAPYACDDGTQHACKRNLYTDGTGDGLTASGRALRWALWGARGYP